MGKKWTHIDNWTEWTSEQVEWRRFPNLPGSHICWRPIAKRQYEMVTSDELTLARARFDTKGNVKSVSTRLGGLLREFDRRVIGPEGKGSTSTPAALVDVGTGVPVVREDQRMQHRSKAQATLTGGKSYEFTTSGQSPGSAIMTGLDESGSETVYYRFNDPELSMFKVWNRPFDPRTMEIVTSPSVPLDEGVVLLVALTSNWLDRYFRPPV